MQKKIFKGEIKKYKLFKNNPTTLIKNGLKKC